ncbi:MAG: DUF2254 domain-containing protein [Micropruina sp.]|uniref:DUF2254 domain-containing protein n=1 Tax=Micropruina sp. TaxID=2737536 RepID=UPI0039E49C9F
MTVTNILSDKQRETLSGSLWFFPLVMTLGALVLGAVLSQVRVPENGPLSPVLYHGGAEDARRLLLGVATSTVGVFALVVGLTLVALQVAGNRYSPRLVRSFLRDRATQVVFGLFIATFAYNAAGLYTVGAQDDYPRLAVTIGLVLLFACIGALVFYVDRVAHSLQTHSILNSVGVAARRAIEALPPGIGRSAGMSGLDGVPWDEPPVGAIQLLAPRSGYVQRLQMDALMRAALAEDVVIQLVPGIGGHVVAGTPLAWACPANGGSVRPEPLARAVNRAITIGAGRSSYNDVALGAIQMVDMALLSMHVFDYHTVEQSCAELGVLLGRVAGVPVGPEAVIDSTGTIRVLVPGLYFQDYLELACGEIRRKGSSEPVVLLALVKQLRAAGATATSQRLSLVRRELELVRASAEADVHEPHDRERVLREVDRTLLLIGAGQPERPAIQLADQ